MIKMRIVKKCKYARTQVGDIVDVYSYDELEQWQQDSIKSICEEIFNIIGFIMVDGDIPVFVTNKEVESID